MKNNKIWFHAWDLKWQHKNRMDNKIDEIDDYSLYSFLREEIYEQVLDASWSTVSSYVYDEMVYECFV